MWLGHTIKQEPMWTGISCDSSVMYAARVCHAPNQQPQLVSLTLEPAPDLGKGLRALSHAKLLKGAHLCGVLNRAQYRLLSVDAPDIPQAEWRDAMRWRLKEYVDFPMDDALLDILAIPEGTQMRPANSAIALVAQRQDYNTMATAADELGMYWRGLDVPETTLSVLSAIAAKPGQAHALLVFGQSFAILVITYKGALVMTRTIEVSIHTSTEAADAQGTALGRAALEILRTLDSYERKHSEAPLNAVSVVVPPEAEDVLEVLADLIYLPVEKFLLSQWLDVSAIGEHAQRVGQSGSLAEYAAIGAALRGYAQHQGWQTLQMLDPQDKQKNKKPWSAITGLRLTSAVGGLAIMAGAAMTAGSYWIGQKTHKIEQTLKGGQTTASRPQTPIEIQQLNTMRLREKRQRQLLDAMLSAAQKAQEPYSQYLAALAKQTLPELWITGLKVASGGQDMVLAGRMTDPTKLPHFLTRLEQEPQFQGRRFAQVELRAIGAEQGVTTQITEFILRENPAQKEETK